MNTVTATNAASLKHFTDNNAHYGYWDDDAEAWTSRDPRLGFEGTDPQEYAYAWRPATAEELKQAATR